MNQLLKRTISGALFLALMLAGLLLSEFTYMGLMSAVLVCSSLEFFRLTVPGRYTAEKVCVVFSALAFFVMAFCCVRFALPSKWLLPCLIPLPLACIMMIFHGAPDHFFDTAVFFPLLYIALPVVSSIFLVFPTGGYTPWVLLSLFALIWLSDIGAYLVGMAFGQRSGSHKLFPSISPKKSWAGVAGGVLFTFLAAWGVKALFEAHPEAAVLPDNSWWVLAAIVAVLGIFGDLFESLIKRHAEVKDSGTIIPGHGGLLDRFDDVFFILPVAAAYLMFIVY
ncbi:MAG: phosphatidate cytidylyltransferase [Bacteroidales bacterium]|nr:phosphatidate cytidylyltransferase [Bacteroidales bacterium]